MHAINNAVAAIKSKVVLYPKTSLSYPPRAGAIAEPTAKDIF
jgi:hypothetical protein